MHSDLSIIFLLCTHAIITVSGLNNSILKDSEPWNGEPFVGLVRHNSLRHDFAPNGNTEKQNLKKSSDISSGGKQRTLEIESNKYYSEDFSASYWSKTIPNANSFFQLTTSCPTGELDWNKCTCEVKHNSGAGCARCSVCPGNLRYYIDCSNLYPYDYSCPIVNCDGNCVSNPSLPAPEVNEMAAGIVVLTMILFLLLGTSPCCIALFCPNGEGSSFRWGRRYPSISPMPQNPEIRQPIIDSCIMTRTLSATDPLVCKNVTNFDERTKNNDLPFDEVEMTISKITQEEASHDPCQICLEPFQEGDKVSSSLKSNCNHEFHHGCITEWLKLHETCPTCRDKFISQD